MSNPMSVHGNTVDNLITKMTGKDMSEHKSVRDIIAEVIPQVVEGKTAEPAPAAEVAETVQPVEAAPVDNVVAETTEPAPVEKAVEKAAPTAVQKKLSRSMEIQRRADAAARRARAEAGKLRATPAPAPKQAQEAVTAAHTAETAQIDAARQALADNIRLLKNDPLAFAKKHGVSGQALADFVKEGADPIRRSIENLEKQHAAEVAKIREEFGQQLAGIRDTVIQTQEAEAQRNFFTFVEESKSANPEAFAALESGLVYSDKDVWDVANHLLETRKDLQDNYDEDKLLEAVEVEARKDPRWKKLQQLTRKNKPTGQPQVAAKVKTNASTTEVEELDNAPPVKQAVAPRDSGGRFLPELPASPFTRHEMHVENIKRTQRFFG